MADARPSAIFGLRAKHAGEERKGRCRAFRSRNIQNCPCSWRAACYASWSAGGAWRHHVDIVLARRDGDEEWAARLETEGAAELAALLAAFGKAKPRLAP